LIPEKIELIQGKLFWSEEARLNMLGLLLEKLGLRRLFVWQYSSYQSTLCYRR
jgi:hypothetical protein